MKTRSIRCGAREVSYTLKRYSRQRCIRLIAHQDGTLVVTAPRWVRVREIERFVEDRKMWIEKHVIGKVRTEYSNAQKRLYKKLARQRVTDMLDRVNGYYEFLWGRVSVRESRSQWGSCSSKKNLSFSWRVALLKDDLLEYIVAHELCHLKEMNHSPAFWELVSHSVPDYRERRKSLKDISI